MTRPRVVFLDYPDVFEDFYPRYGVDLDSFRSFSTGSSSILRVIAEQVADVTWLVTTTTRRRMSFDHVDGFQVEVVPSSLLHRVLWREFYGRPWSWRLFPWFDQYATAASYLAPLSAAVLRRLASLRPEAVFVQDYATGRFDTAVALARVLRCRVVAYHAGARESGYVGTRIRPLAMRAADALLTSAGTESTRLIESYGVDPNRVAVLLTPVDLDVFRPGPRVAACERSRLDPARARALFVGRLDDSTKRVRLLIDAFAEATGNNPHVELVIVGDGEDRQMIERHAAAVLGDRVQVRGWVSSRAELADLYRAADALVLPSRREGFPTVVGEALASGLPVIASDVGGISEVVSHGVTGWLFDAEQVSDLTAGLKVLAEEPVRFQDMRRAARAVAEQKLAPDAVADVLRRALLGGQTISSPRRETTSGQDPALTVTDEPS